MENRTGRRKLLSAVVVSDKMDKTRVVRVTWKTKHSIYQKPIKRGKKYKVHDENNASKTGDVVRIMETRPISKDKRWTIREVIKGSQAK